MIANEQISHIIIEDKKLTGGVGFRYEVNKQPQVEGSHNIIY